MVEGDSSRAKLVLMRAEADAEAAREMARAKTAQTRATRALEDVERVRAQMKMQQPGGSQ
jgi:predicted metal-binding transcription factor (methanogenesis marker protein 9)